MHAASHCISNQQSDVPCIFRGTLEHGAVHAMPGYGRLEHMRGMQGCMQCCAQMRPYRGEELDDTPCSMVVAEDQQTTAAPGSQNAVYDVRPEGASSEPVEDAQMVPAGEQRPWNAEQVMLAMMMRGLI